MLAGMPDPPNLQRNLRLGMLIRLRWLSVIGQTAMVLVVHYGLDFALPLLPCLSIIAMAVWLNLMLIPGKASDTLEPGSAAWLLAFDIGELTALLFFTGGLQNPFEFLILGPVVISAMALPGRHTIMLGIFAAVCATALVFVHYPLPWSHDESVELPRLYMLGVWSALLLALGFISAYAWHIAKGTRRLADALAATELALAREQHLSQLDGLAAAAAHELATPLSTITVIAKELEREIAADSPHAEDIRLLREQAQRCRDILGKLTQLSTTQEPFARPSLSALIEEVAAPHRNFGINIDVILPPEMAGEPMGTRNPAMLYGLGNLVENAVDFATSRVEIAARWSAKEIAITISDDGPGFAPDIIARLGEPYVSSRGRDRSKQDADSAGLGLGFFIAKTLLERTEAVLAFANRTPPDHGAVVHVRWDRADFDEAFGGAQNYAGAAEAARPPAAVDPTPA
jgi:two-component system sensor histidine kinase RegB